MNALLVSMLLMFGSNDIPAPHGWRIVQVKEMADEGWRVDDAHGFLRVEADFDGDGNVDTAFLAQNTLTKKYGLFVSTKKYRSPRLLEKLDDIQNVGISALKPGKYKTACGKGYNLECKDVPDEVSLEYSAIELFWYGSASLIHAWIPYKQKFVSYQLSD
jgi:hypothetical protein